VVIIRKLERITTRAVLAPSGDQRGNSATTGEWVSCKRLLPSDRLACGSYGFQLRELPGLSGIPDVVVSPFWQRKMLHSRLSPRKGRALWPPAKPRNAHIQFVPVRSLRKNIVVRSARRWKTCRTWIASARTRSARAEPNTRHAHSHRRRPPQRVRSKWGIRQPLAGRTYLVKRGRLGQ